LSMAAVRGI